MSDRRVDAGVGMCFGACEVVVLFRVCALHRFGSVRFYCERIVFFAGVASVLGVYLIVQLCSLTSVSKLRSVSATFLSSVRSSTALSSASSWIASNHDQEACPVTPLTVDDRWSEGSAGTVACFCVYPRPSFPPNSYPALPSPPPAKN